MTMRHPRVEGMEEMLPRAGMLGHFVARTVLSPHGKRGYEKAVHLVTLKLQPPVIRVPVPNQSHTERRGPLAPCLSSRLLRDIRVVALGLKQKQR